MINSSRSGQNEVTPGVSSSKSFSLPSTFLYHHHHLCAGICNSAAPLQSTSLSGCAIAYASECCFWFNCQFYELSFKILNYSVQPYLDSHGQWSVSFLTCHLSFQKTKVIAELFWSKTTWITKIKKVKKKKYHTIEQKGLAISANNKKYTCELLRGEKLYIWAWKQVSLGSVSFEVMHPIQFHYKLNIGSLCGCQAGLVLWNLQTFTSSELD